MKLISVVAERKFWLTVARGVRLVAGEAAGDPGWNSLTIGESVFEETQSWRRTPQNSSDR
jgi:hypothetical protein